MFFKHSEHKREKPHWMNFDIMRLNANFGIVCVFRHKIFITWRLVLGIVRHLSRILTTFTSIHRCFTAASFHLYLFLGAQKFDFHRFSMSNVLQFQIIRATIWNVFGSLTNINKYSHEHTHTHVSSHFIIRMLKAQFIFEIQMFRVDFILRNLVHLYNGEF